MTLRADPAPAATTRVPRFGPAQRRVHRATALLMGVCVVTAACLYVPQLAELVGRRDLVVRIHEWAGLALPVPVLAGLASRAFRADLGGSTASARTTGAGCGPSCAGTSAGRPVRRASSTPGRRSTPPGWPGPRW